MRIHRFFLTFSLLLAFCAGFAPASARTGEAAGRSDASAAPGPGERRDWPGQTFRFEHIGLEQGLSQSSVRVILQDRRGFLWFGTEDGLNRYDGYSFKVFKPDRDDPYSISDRWINTLYEDRAGNLWVGTRLGGLNRYDPQTGRFTHFTHTSPAPAGEADPASLSSNKVNAIYEDERGILWVGTDAGLDWLDPIGRVVTHIRSNPADTSTLSGNRINVIFSDSRGVVWVGTEGAGLNQYNAKSRSFVRYPIASSGTNRICSSTINAIAETGDGRLWLGTPGGLTRFDPKGVSTICFKNNPLDPASLSDNNIEALFVDSAGNLWAGAARGLDQFQPATNGFTRLQYDPARFDGLSAETVLSIYEDRGGVLWVGTYGGGLNKHDPTEERFALFRHEADNPLSLSNSFIFPIHEDERGSIWIGTYGGGLNHFDPRTGVFTRYQHDPADPASLADNYVWSIYADSRGRLWIGTANALSRMDSPGKFTHYFLEEEDSEGSGLGIVYAMLESPNGALWLGTEHGLGLFDPADGSYTPETFPAQVTPAIGKVVSLYQDDAHILWFGTLENGLYRYDTLLGELRWFHVDERMEGNLSHNSVMAICRGHDGTLWVATGGGGLNRYNPETETFQAFTEKDGLPNSVVYGILEDKQGRLWLSTNFGVSRFDPSTRLFRNYSLSDGLGSMEFNMNAYVQARDGAMYFGSTSGLSAFYPDSIQDSQYIPPVVLTSLTHEGKPLKADTLPEVTKSIILRAPNNSFEFEFAALGYTASGQNQYAYMLENFDEDWYYLGTRRDGRYTNLPGGEYVLHLKVSNSDGIWSNDSLAIPVTVIPPFWQTWWFRLSLGLAAGLVALAGYRLRVRSVEIRNRELEAQVRARTAEIEKLFESARELAVIEERNRLARDLHDSAKQKAFAALAQLGTVNGLAKGSSAARKHLLEAENLVAEVIQELTFLIQEMYPVGLMEKGLPTTVREYVFEWENRTDIKADVNIEDPRPLELKVEQAIYRVIQESLANVARHSQASHVDVNLVYRPDCIEVEVADDGCGFDVRTTLPGLGLRSMKERIESVLGRIQFESAGGCGTRVIVHVPLPEPEKEVAYETHIHPHR